MNNHENATRTVGDIDRFAAARHLDIVELEAILENPDGSRTEQEMPDVRNELYRLTHIDAMLTGLSAIPCNTVGRITSPFTVTYQGTGQPMHIFHPGTKLSDIHAWLKDTFCLPAEYLPT